MLIQGIPLGHSGLRSRREAGQGRSRAGPLHRLSNLQPFGQPIGKDSNEGVARATSTLRNVEGAWVKDMNVLIENGSIVGYKVNLAITFVLEDAGDIS